MKKPIFKLIVPYEGTEIFRAEKIIFARLSEPHRMISTCRINGGLREDLTFAANHQACEPKACGTEDHKRCLAVRDPEAYHREVCEYHGLPWDKTSLLGTAANMNCAGVRQETFKDLTVACVATAGVESNAGRAGDPATIYEDGSSFHQTDECLDGTINIMLFINQPLTPGAMVRSIKMATEAKTSILQELNVPSRYSQGLATGTGTDQITVCSRLAGGKLLTSAGKHVKLGELIAVAVRESIKRAVGLQNKLTPETLRYLPRLLERYGLGEDALLERLKSLLPRDVFRYVQLNRETMFADPLLLAQALAFVHLLDQIQWQIIPEGSADEALLYQAALVASSASGRPEDLPEYLQNLTAGKGEPISLLFHALAQGLAAKWEVPWRN